MNRTCLWALTLAALLVTHDAVAAGPRCSLRTVVGTYAGITHGNLWVGTADLRTLDPASVPSPELAPPLMPAAQLGIFTVGADGTVTAVVWSGLGSTWWPNLSFTGTMTVNPDCTGQLVYSPFGAPVSNIERLVILDHGWRIEGISQQIPLAPPLAFVSEYHRIGSPFPGGGNHCGQALARGSWVMTCTGFTPTETPNGPVSLSSAMLAAFRVNGTGELGGTAMHKVGPGFIDQTITGALTVNDDCTFDASLDMRPALPFVFAAKGLFYDWANRGAAMPMTATADTPGGPVEAPMPARVCRLERR